MSTVDRSEPPDSSHMLSEVFSHSLSVARSCHGSRIGNLAPTEPHLSSNSRFRGPSIDSCSTGTHWCCNADDTTHHKSVENPNSCGVVSASSALHGEPGIQTSVMQELKRQKPFRKWVKSLRRRAATGQNALSLKSHEQWSSVQPNPRKPRPNWHTFHRASSSGSSFAFVSAVRSASVSLSGVSTNTKPSVHKTRSFCVSLTDQSCDISVSGTRTSEDGSQQEAPSSVEAVVTERSLRRRKILEEIINTEECYIGEIRVLMNVYITIFASLPTIRQGLRSAINHILTEIVELHEEILGELHRVVPNSEYTQIDIPVPNGLFGNSSNRSHRRWRTANTGLSYARLKDIPGMLAEPQLTAEVSRIFGKRMKRFFVYTEYGVRYETVLQDVASAHSVLPTWSTHERGLEILATTLGSARRYGIEPNTALTLFDLLIKPLQRLCKYPLLFAELKKHTPVCDCPDSHLQVDDALERMRDLIEEINSARQEGKIKSNLNKTWLLQDRLSLSHQKLDANSRATIRSFGSIRLCGVLHICWQSKEGVDGQYMICLLYNEVFCLASVNKPEVLFTVRACISVRDMRVEDVDNGRGLQCHTAPFSWKLVFECDYQMYELLMTACNAKEEMEWQTRLGKIPSTTGNDPRRVNLFSSLDLDIKTLGTVFGKPGTIARSLSIHRTTTVGTKQPLYQVVLKNTSATKDSFDSVSAALAMNRSRSLLTTNVRIPILAPLRSERARLETLLTDVWSREHLPFPGMTARSRSETLVRESAIALRRLSSGSITNPISKRSGSTKQNSKAKEDTGHDLPLSSEERRSAKDSLSSRSQWKIEDNRKIKRARTVSRQESQARECIAMALDSASVSRKDDVAIARSKSGTAPSNSDHRSARSWSHSAMNLRYSRSVKSTMTQRVAPDAESPHSKSPRMQIQSPRVKEGRRGGSGHSIRTIFTVKGGG